MAVTRKRHRARRAVRSVVGEQLHQLQVLAPPRQARALQPLLRELFPAGFEERTEGGDTFFVSYAGSAAQLRTLARKAKRAVKAFEGVSVRSSSEPSDWQTRWIAELGPQQLTPYTRVVPVAQPAPRTAKSPDLYLSQRAAFGFGEHATTRLMATELERLLRCDTKRSVLDVGTGTGVLAILAARCGAHPVLGIDIDSESVRAAQANAALNGLATQCIFRDHPLAQVKQSFDIVLANLDVPTLSSLARDLRRTLSKQGLLLVSGVLVEAEATVTAVFSKVGLVRCSRKRQGEWLVVGYRR